MKLPTIITMIEIEAIKVFLPKRGSMEAIKEGAQGFEPIGAGAYASCILCRSHRKPWRVARAANGRGL